MYKHETRKLNVQLCQKMHDFYEMANKNCLHHKCEPKHGEASQMKIFTESIYVHNKYFIL